MRLNTVTADITPPFKQQTLSLQVTQQHRFRRLRAVNRSRTAQRGHSLPIGRLQNVSFRFKMKASRSDTPVSSRPTSEGRSDAQLVRRVAMLMSDQARSSRGFPSPTVVVNRLLGLRAHGRSSLLKKSDEADDVLCPHAEPETRRANDSQRGLIQARDRVLLT